MELHLVYDRRVSGILLEVLTELLFYFATILVMDIVIQLGALFYSSDLRFLQFHSIFIN